MPMNQPKQSIRSASRIDIPRPVDRFDPDVNRQKGEDLRRPQARYRVCSLVTRVHEVKKSLNLAAMTLLGVTRHNAHALY